MTIDELVVKLDHEEALKDQNRADAYNEAKGQRAEWASRMLAKMTPEEQTEVDALRVIYTERDARRAEIKHRLATWNALAEACRAVQEEQEEKDQLSIETLRKVWAANTAARARIAPLQVSGGRDD